jgi:hypothetical protein
LAALLLWLLSSVPASPWITTISAEEIRHSMKARRLLIAATVLTVIRMSLARMKHSFGGTVIVSSSCGEMAEVMSQIIQFVQEHGIALTAAGWVVLSAVLNTVFRFVKPADLVAWAERNPRVAALDAFLRAMGVDPVTALIALWNFAKGKGTSSGT